MKSLQLLAMTTNQRFLLGTVGGGGLIWINLLAKPLGIPQPWGELFLIPGILMFVFGTRRSKKANPDNPAIAQPASATILARRKVFWIYSGSLVLGTLVMLPLLPYTVDNFRPPLYAFIVPGDLIALGLAIWYLHKKLIQKLAKLDRIKQAQFSVAEIAQNKIT